MATFRYFERARHADERLVAVGPIARAIWDYLCCNQQDHVSGVYRLSVAAASEDTGWPVEAFESALAELEQVRLIERDPAVRLVWVRNMFRKNHPKPTANHLVSVERHLASMPRSSLIPRFVEYYEKRFGISVAYAVDDGPMPMGSEGDPHTIRIPFEYHPHGMGDPIRIGSSPSPSPSLVNSPLSEQKQAVVNQTAGRPTETVDKPKAPRRTATKDPLVLEVLQLVADTMARCGFSKPVDAHGSKCDTVRRCTTKHKATIDDWRHVLAVIEAEALAGSEFLAKVLPSPTQLAKHIERNWERYREKSPEDVHRSARRNSRMPPPPVSHGTKRPTNEQPKQNAGEAGTSSGVIEDFNPYDFEKFLS